MEIKRDLMPFQKGRGHRKETLFYLASPISLPRKGWLAIAKLIPLSLFISPLLMPNEAFDNVRIEK